MRPRGSSAASASSASPACATACSRYAAVACRTCPVRYSGADLRRRPELAPALIGDPVLAEPQPQLRLRHPRPARLRRKSHVEHALHARGRQLGHERVRPQRLVADRPQRRHGPASGILLRHIGLPRVGARTPSAHHVAPAASQGAEVGVPAAWVMTTSKAPPPLRSARTSATSSASSSGPGSSTGKTPSQRAARRSGRRFGQRAATHTGIRGCCTGTGWTSSAPRLDQSARGRRPAARARSRESSSSPKRPRTRRDGYRQCRRRARAARRSAP